MSATAPVRCAVYTRKSTEEGLDQEFNSLDAQRESGEAYIRAHKGEGWILVPDFYDDGGFSGGNTDRPALKRLMADVEAGKIDTIVVYKVDRLTRSLADFAQLVDVLDQSGVSFVSVTQHFNTRDSMGRLTLNILLTFAQFEREVIGERIRDKFALSKQKGKFMGGRVPTGYDVKERRLVINPKEAAGIRMLFQSYVETGSMTEACRRTNKAGYTTKRNVFSNGQISGGTGFDRKNIIHILKNRIYLGEVPHKGRWYPGEHEPIISQELWDRVQAVRTSRTSSEKKAQSKKQSTGSFLNGRIFGPDGIALVGTSTRKGGKRYRYFISNTVNKKGYDHAPLPMIACGELEQVVLDSLGDMLVAPEYMARVERVLQKQGYDKPNSPCAMLKDIGQVWSLLFPEEQRRLFQLLVERVDVTAEKNHNPLSGQWAAFSDSGSPGSARDKAADNRVKRHELDDEWREEPGYRKR